MIWRISDGTVVHLGGQVDGASYFAQYLRADIDDPPTIIGIDPPPSRGIELDLNDPTLLDLWLEGETQRPFLRHLSLSIVERPDGIPPLKRKPYVPRERADGEQPVY